MVSSSLTVERLREVLNYDPDTGLLTWRVALSSRVRVGKKAGRATKDGYIRIRIYGKDYMAHRLAWVHVHGALPLDQIDHIDGDTGNNKLSNLRDVSAQHNKENTRKANKVNSSGYLGISKSGKKWAAKIQVGRKNIHLGSFCTQQLAHDSYLSAKRELHSGCTI